MTAEIELQTKRKEEIEDRMGKMQSQMYSYKTRTWVTKHVKEN